MPIYLFWGEEDYSLDIEIECIKNKVFNTSGDSASKIEISPLNYKTLDNPPVKDLISALKSQPMMFGDIIYKIKADKYFLEIPKKIKLDDKQNDDLISAISLISDRVHVILTCPVPRGDRKKPDSRKKFFKAIQKAGIVKEFPAFKAYEEYKIAPVLKTMIAKKGLKADSSVISDIIRQTGPSLRDLDTVLEKLKLTAHPSTVITNKMVDEACKGSENIFLLSDLIIKKEYTKALGEIANLLSKSHYLEILSFLQSSLLKLLQTKLYMKTMSPYDIARKTGQNEYIVKKTVEKLFSVSLEELVKLKQNLTDAEYSIKTGAKEPLVAFEGVFFEDNSKGGAL